MHGNIMTDAFSVNRKNVKNKENNIDVVSKWHIPANYAL